MSNFKERAAGYLRDAGGVNLEKIAVYIGLGIAIIAVLKTLRIGAAVTGAVANATNATGTAIGAKLADWFQKPPNELTTYAVQFPDGSKHAIDSRLVQSDGSFLYNNVRYRLRVDKSIVSGVNKFAVRL